MKKYYLTISLSIAVILASAIFCIAQMKGNDTAIGGTCKGETEINICIFLCPNCGAIFAPIDGSNPKGTEAVITKGICPGCSYNFSTGANGNI